MVVAEYSISCEPPQDMSREEVVRVALEPIVRRGLKHEVEPLGSTVEGELKSIFEAVEEAHELLIGRGVDRLTTNLRIEDKRGGTSIDDKLDGFRSAHVGSARAITD